MKTHKVGPVLAEIFGIETAWIGKVIDKLRYPHTHLRQ